MTRNTNTANTLIFLLQCEIEWECFYQNRFMRFMRAESDSDGAVEYWRQVWNLILS